METDASPPRGREKWSSILEKVPARPRSNPRIESFSAAVCAGGDDFYEAIIIHMKRAYDLMIGHTAEEIKIRTGSASALDQEFTMEVDGRSLGTGSPKTVAIRAEEIREALKEPLSSVLESVREGQSQINRGERSR